MCGLWAKAHAGPWTQPAGSGQIISRTDQYSATSETVDGTFEFEQNGVGLYGEYGLTEKITVGANLFYADQTTTGPINARGASGLTVADFFIQTPLRRRDYSVVSARLIYGAETDITQFRVDGTTSADAVDASVEPGLLFGKTLDQAGRHYLTLETGYRASLGADADFLRAEFGYGFRPIENWLLSFKTYSRTSAQNADEDGLDVDFVRIEPSLAWETGRYGTYEIGVSKDISTRNMTAGEAFFFSLWTRF